ncbi:MAG: hypothetical protein HYT69_00300 [Candidatus Zambryskibacteria bacterium]|nr:hypothetical protein [Candidatus Zambryskibacteria bacterium]
MISAIGSLPPPLSPEQLAHSADNLGYWPLAVYMMIVFGIPTWWWLKRMCRKLITSHN